MPRLPVVCLVGSTKPDWQERYKQVNRDLTLAGYVVISVAMFRPDVPNIEDHRDLLERIHFQKMDMADFVVLIHKDAIGPHTALEIARCMDEGKPVVTFTTMDEFKPPKECPRPAMTVRQYQEAAGTTAIYPGRGTITGLMYVALGLGESGEVQGKVKKILRDAGGVLTYETRAAIAHELGDVLWYIAQTCDEIKMPMEMVAAWNLEKLADRKARDKLHGDGDHR